MKTGFSLLEILHRENLVLITGMGLQWSLIHWIFNFFQTYRLQQEENSSSNYLRKNPVPQIGYFKLKNCKNHVEIDSGYKVFSSTAIPYRRVQGPHREIPVMKTGSLQ